ncbi:MAG TPA: PAS domain-containing protein, partial [Candidatus Deferrimicrobium sp.]|nr:PAS domain-containing protein [Candidatus Deferrimicrobium sp.]
MKNQTWTQEFPAAITICNAEGVIIEMNEAAAKVFANDGGAQLVGKNALDCHPEPSRSKMREMLKKPAVNAY